MYQCFDHNQTPLQPGDWICHINPKSYREQEGCITKCLQNNHVTLDAEEGIITVDAHDCYILPDEDDKDEQTE